MALLQFTFLGDELSPLNAIFLHMWWCLLVWQHDIFINNTLYHPALFQRKYVWCSPHLFLYIWLIYPSINYVLFHRLYSQHFFVCLFVFFFQKRPWKSEICLVDYQTPSSLFWRLTGNLTANIIIKLDFFLPLFSLLTHWNHPFICLPHPVSFLLELWQFTHQLSLCHYLQIRYLDLLSVSGPCASQASENLWDIPIDLAVDY